MTTKDYTQINLPFIQIIKTRCTLSIWLGLLLITLDWWELRPKGAKLISIDWNPD